MTATPTPAVQQAQAMLTLTQGAKYDRDEIYASAVDDKGHNVEIRVKITPSFEAELMALVQSHVRPKYRTIQDFARSSMTHQWKYEIDQGNTTSLPNGGTAIFNREIMDSQTRYWEAEIAAWDTSIQAWETMSEKLLSKGALKQLRRMLDEYEPEFYSDTGMPDVAMDQLEATLEGIRTRLDKAEARRNRDNQDD